MFIVVGVTLLLIKFFSCKAFNGSEQLMWSNLSITWEALNVRERLQLALIPISR